MRNFTQSIRNENVYIFLFLQDNTFYCIVT